MSENESLKLQVDDDWKNQAQREKETLGGAPAAAASAPAKDASTDAPAKAGGPARQAIPPASFELLVQQMVTQIMMSTGEMEHPTTGRRTRNLEVAKHYIDMLAVLEQKTKNNLSAEEQNLLDSALYQMRMQYVAVARAR